MVLLLNFAKSILVNGKASMYLLPWGKDDKGQVRLFSSLFLSRAVFLVPEEEMFTWGSINVFFSLFISSNNVFLLFYIIVGHKLTIALLLFFILITLLGIYSNEINETKLKKIILEEMDMIDQPYFKTMLAKVEWQNHNFIRWQVYMMLHDLWKMTLSLKLGFKQNQHCC